jgi:hypothetical protein
MTVLSRSTTRQLQGWSTMSRSVVCGSRPSVATPSLVVQDTITAGTERDHSTMARLRSTSKVAFVTL